MKRPARPRDRGGRTVTVSLRGGLGNQMFQYAAGLAIALRQRRRLLLDDSPLLYNAPGTTPRRYALDIFQLDRPVVRQPPDGAGVAAVLQEFLPPFEPAVLEQLPFAHVRLQGFWQSERYFPGCEARLRRDFRFKAGGWTSSPWESAIRQSACSVAVHVRRQDYLTTHAGQRLGFLGAEYYSRALSRLGRAARDLHVFVFSDDIAWCRENLAFPCPQTHVHHEGAAPEVAACEFRLMSLCRHFVIANSSYSWWAAWLGAAPDKRVIAPRTWFRDSARHSKDVVPRRWIRV